MPRILGIGFEKFEGLIHGHVQNVPDVGPFVLDLQGFPVVPLSPADVAGHINVREEVHLDLDDPVSAAGFAPPPLDVEAVAAFLVAAGAGFGKLGEELPDVGEDAGIGGRVRAGGAPDGGLVDFDDLVDLPEPLNLPELSGLFLGMINLLGEGAVERVENEGALSGPRNARNAGE